MNDVEKLRGQANRMMPAFPIVGCGMTFVGLTKRELFAAIVLQGMLSNPSTSQEESIIKKQGFPDAAYFHAESEIALLRADALLAELEKKL